MGGSEEVIDEDPLVKGAESKQLAICLVSGGMDSCVSAAIASKENDELAFLHVSYGQRTERRERESLNASRIIMASSLALLFHSNSLLESVALR